MVLSLSWQNAVVIKVLGLDFEVPLSDHGRFVSCFSHFDGKHLLAGFNPASQIDGSIDMVVLAGQDAGSGGRADGVCAEGVFEKSPFFGKAIKVGGRSDLGKSATVSGNAMGGVIVRHDVKDVGLAVGE